MSGPVAPHTYAHPSLLYARSTIAFPVDALYDGLELDELDELPDELLEALELAAVFPLLA